MTPVDALYLAGLAGLAGYVLVGRMPSVLHVPLLAGANLVHGIVLVGAILAFSVADGGAARGAGLVAIALASANVAGGLLLSERLFALFERGRTGRAAPSANGGDGTDVVGRAGGDHRRDRDVGRGGGPGDPGSGGRPGGGTR